MGGKISPRRPLFPKIPKRGSKKWGGKKPRVKIHHPCVKLRGNPPIRGGIIGGFFSPTQVIRLLFPPGPPILMGERGLEL